MRKILFLTTIPLSSKSGGATYSNRVLELLRDSGHQVDVVEIAKCSKQSFFMLRLRALVKGLVAGKNPVFVFWQSALERAKLDFDRYDVVVSDHVEVYPYDSTRPVILVAHNIETDVLRMRLKARFVSAPKIFEESFRFEIRAWNAARLVIAISDGDVSTIESYGGRAMLVPPVKLQRLKLAQPLSRRHRKIRIGYIGSINWRPNREALRLLLDEICPKIRIPFQVVVAGRGNSDFIASYSDRYDVLDLGQIDTVEEFWLSVDCLVCPMRSGAGSSVKAWEALSFGKAIIGTNLAVRGLPGTLLNEKLISDDVQELPIIIERWWADSFSSSSPIEPPRDLLEKSISQAFQDIVISA